MKSILVTGGAGFIGSKFIPPTSSLSVQSLKRYVGEQLLSCQWSKGGYH